jgi:hypothetical protein
MALPILVSKAGKSAKETATSWPVARDLASLFPPASRANAANVRVWPRLSGKMDVQLSEVDSLALEVLTHLVVRDASVVNFGLLTDMDAMCVSGQNLQQKGATAARSAKH